MYYMDNTQTMPLLKYSYMHGCNCLHKGVIMCTHMLRISQTIFVPKNKSTEVLQLYLCTVF